MSTDKKQFLKLALNSPDHETLQNVLPDVSESDIRQIFSLKQCYLEKQSVFKQIQDVSHALSRKIGTAKKQGADTDALLIEMRAASSELKRIGETLQEIEDKILDYLPTTSLQAGSQAPSSVTPQASRYIDARCDNNINIALLQDDTELWNNYAGKHPAASIYHLADWRNIVRTSFGHEAYYFYAYNADGAVKGILPLIRLNSRLFGDFMVSMPYFNYGGALGDHPLIEDKLIRQANELAADQGLEHIEYRDDISKADWPERTDKVNMILALPADEDTLWQSFSPKLRSQIKRPQREDTRIKLGGLELLDDFYSVFARNMRDLGTPVYAKAFFRNIICAFPGNARILIITLGKKPVAGAFLLGYKNMLEIPWASTIRSVNHLSINMLMYWEILRFAIREKYSYFDFGRSSMDSGTYKFKKQWGAQPKQLYWHYWLNNREMPALNPSNPKYKLMINVWKKLPIWLTNLIGPMVVKNLP